MTSSVPASATAETGAPADSQRVVHVRYWASARAAAGCSGDDVPVSGPLTLADVVAEVVRRHPGGNLSRVLAACSVLVGERPVSTEDPAEVVVEPGASVEFLPPFAGG